MALDDYLEPEVAVVAAVTAAVTAAVASPQARKAMRRAAVYGMAGLLVAYDKIVAAARGVAENARHAAEPAPNGVAQPSPAAPPVAEGGIPS